MTLNPYDYIDDDDSAETARAEGRKAGYTAGKADGLQLGRAEGAAAERDRIRQIMALNIARERPREAAHVALSTSIEPCKADEAIRGMMIGAQAAADRSWNDVREQLKRGSGFGGRR